MTPLIVLVASFVLFLTLGSLQLPMAFGWWTALRLALAVMFLLTASAHWGKRRPDLVRMVPRSFPHAEFLVTATGLLEIAGAIGLMAPNMARVAAAGLSILLVAVFPANVRAAKERLTIAGQSTPPLVLRSVIQIIFLCATVSVAIGTGR